MKVNLIIQAVTSIYILLKIPNWNNITFLIAKLRQIKLKEHRESKEINLRYILSMMQEIQHLWPAALSILCLLKSRQVDFNPILLDTLRI